MHVRPRFQSAALALFLALSLAPAPTLAAARVSAGAAIDRPLLHAEGRTSALVHVRPGGSMKESVTIARGLGLDVGTVYDDIAVYVAHGEARDLRRLAHSSSVEAIEANRKLTFFTDSSHKATRGQDVLDGAITLPDGTVIDGSGVGVAIVDSGIDGSHPALRNRMASNVKIMCASHVTSVYIDPIVRPDECVHPAGKVVVPMDDTDTPSAGGHGTHVAGIVAGEPNGTPYHGAAPGARLYGISVGMAVTVENALDGMRWVLDTNAAAVAAGDEPPIHVVNNSWGTDQHARYPAGGPQPNHLYFATWKMQDALVASGVTVVQAAGNTGGNGSAATTSPQCVNQTPGVICVANYYDGDTGTRAGNIDGSSSRGVAGTAFADTWPDVSAPGTRIVSTCRLTLPVCSGDALQGNTDSHIEEPPNQYARLTGTSMAAPHVAGIVAQLLQADPSLTPAEIEDVLEDTAYKFIWGSKYDFVDPANADDASSFEKGHGLVDVLAAVRYVLDDTQPDPDPSPTWTPQPDPTLPPAGPAQTFYFHSTTTNNQVDQLAGANSFDGTRPSKLAASAAIFELASVHSAWTGEVEGPIQSVRLGFWQKTTDESTGTFGVNPVYSVQLQVGSGTGAETYDLGTISTQTDGSELPAARFTGTFTRHLVPDTPSDPDKNPDSLPLNVDPEGRPVTLRLEMGWFHGYGAILYDSAQFPSGFSVNPPPACPDPGTPAVTSQGFALEETLYLHSTTRNGAADAPLGGTTFDATAPSAIAPARFDDAPFARNRTRGGPLDPNWTGAVDGIICSLTVDIWQKQLLGELIGQTDYLPTLWVGDTKFDLPPVQVKVPMNFDDVTRISFTVDQMLDERGFVLPLMIDPNGEPVTLELAGRYIDADLSTVTYYDSIDRPSSITINEGYTPTQTVTALSLNVLGNGSKRTLVATLTDSVGVGIAGKAINFLVDGVEVGAASTDGSGVAVLSPSAKFPGHRLFRAEFRGDESHSESGAEVAT